jgi:hypothetical protein
MNLCGGIVGAADADFFMPSMLPSGSLDDGVNLTLESATKKLTTPRRKKKDSRFLPDTHDYVAKTVSPSARSSKNKKTSSTLDDTPSPLLNPLSKEDLQKSRNRQRPVYTPRSSTMSHSANMKRLESGFRLVSYLQTNKKKRNACSSEITSSFLNSKLILRFAFHSDRNFITGVAYLW